MTPLLFAALLGLPLYPLNPVEEDTISFTNLHITAGLNGPGAVVSTGPDLTAKYEMVVYHPVIVRAAVDYRYGSVSSNVYPDGDLHRVSFSIEGIYYRGTDELTGYVGLGLLWSVNSFTLADNEVDSLFNYHGITDVAMNNPIGYRITAGLRLHRVYSIEVSLTESRPKYIFTQQLDANRWISSTEQFRQNDFRLSFGYLFTLKL